MNRKDPKLTALQFNEYINGHDVRGLSNLMTANHTFIDRANQVDKGKESMTKGWMDFFASFPDYKNTFNRVESRNTYDPAIWTAKIENDLVAEWRIYEDTEENREKFSIV
ncbi:hypothetical protein AMJ87_04250 [candidate division WOR_3 bacterium SM23_60]|uniref:SnoaL-like domain-containing protein n=1 Tax=candidate division WOR_3 bacterium SM23_60 TaxID=1703780 RepID=A0A0S8GHW4_UNCW3|nr:MAG: hypothetical protein AMJ87_04250 [candidate division WOR_3 bacterium SM23_60]